MRLTRLEKQMLLDAAGFVLAGEWPFSEQHEDRDRAALERAADKLRTAALDRAARGD